MSIRIIPVLVLAALGLSAPAANDAGRKQIRIGILDYAGSDYSRDHWAPTQAALAAALPDMAVELVPLSLDALDQSVAGGELEFVITNPGNYAVLEYRHRISRIATAEGDLPVASTLVTTGALKSLADLAGRRLAIVSPEAFGGFQIMWADMEQLDKSLRGHVQLVVTGYPMQSAADAVLDGRADAAVLRACLLEELKRSNPAHYGALHAFALQPADGTDCAMSSPLYPDWPFARTQQAPPDLAKRVAVALLQMKAGNLWAVPSDYQPVHELMRALKIGPYVPTGPGTLWEFVDEYRDWLIALAIALVFWALYSVRIETLVRRRTQALNAANAGLQREIAERQRAEEANRLHQRELEHVARLSILGEMASAIAHELNQPLSAISMYAQGSLMRIRAGSATPEEMERAASETAQQAERAATVIKRIRAFVHKRDSQLVPVDLAAMLRDCAQLFEATTHRAGVEVEMSLDPDLPPVMADRVQMQQVVLNLVQNAVDAMAGTPAEARWLGIRLTRESDPTHGPGLCISVRDCGPGLDSAGMLRFAEAFHTTKPEGIGLGLALSRSIVEAHGGWLRAETPEDGQGLRVRMWVPEGAGA